MPKYDNNSIISQFPQSLDAAGTIPRITINPVDSDETNFTKVMRADEIGGHFGELVRNYNLVKFCVDVPNETIIGMPSTSMLDFTKTEIVNLTRIIRDNLNPAINQLLTEISTDLGLVTPYQFTITHADILKCSFHPVPAGLSGSELYAYRGYEIVVYGQYSPNPAAPAPAAPCEILSPYQFNVAYNYSPSWKGNASVDPGATNYAVAELFPKGGGTGVNFNAVCVFGYPVAPPVAVGEFYAIKVEYTPLLAGTVIPIKLRPQYIDLGTQYLNDTGAPFYVLAQRAGGTFNLRVETFAQIPSAGENNPIITLSIHNASCVS